MKKLLAFLWLIIYTCVSTGFTVSTHICMNERQSVEFGAVKKESCDKCGMPKKEANGCCRDDVKVVKLQQDTQLAKLLMPSFELALPVVVISEHLASPFHNFTKNQNTHPSQPPPLHSQDLCIANSVFRI